MNPLSRYFWKRGANPNIIDKHGLYTPLSIASLNNNITLVTLLLEHGADVNFQHHKSETALTVAAKECKNFALVEMLLTYGADPYLEDKYGVNTVTGLKRYCRDTEKYKKMKKLIVGH